MDRREFLGLCVAPLVLPARETTIRDVLRTKGASDRLIAEMERRIPTCSCTGLIASQTFELWFFCHGKRCVVPFLLDEPCGSEKELAERAYLRFVDPL